MRRAFATLLFLLAFSGSKAQLVPATASDLETAKPVVVNKTYTFLASPKGFGSTQEFPLEKKRPRIYFETERNSMWLKLDIPFNGILTFELRPHNPKDDYDWMLFEHTSNLKIQLKQLEPSLLRSNNSRNNIQIGGRTGLKEGNTEYFEVPGPGKSYSKPLVVKKGQQLAIIIDNIYDGGAGFDFVSELKPQVLAYRTLTGNVSDAKTGRPLKANVICEDDSTGTLLGETMASDQGTYRLRVPSDRPINVTATLSGYYFQTKDMTAEATDTNCDFNLSPISDEERLMLFNINFTADKDQITPSSEPELNRLTDLLKNGKNWDVRIIGHTNNNPFADAKYLQKLSFNRAISVKQYLVRNGVLEKRISCAGMGGKNPLVDSRDVNERWRNLRVEVVLSSKN